MLETSSEAQGPAGLIPALPLEQATVGEILRCLRQCRDADLARNLAEAPEIPALLQDLLAQTPPSPLDDRTLQDLVQLAAGEAAPS